jgi:hypothetical protein
MSFKVLTGFVLAIVVVCFSVFGYSQEQPDQGNSDYSSPPVDRYTQEQAAPTESLRDYELEKAKLELERARADADRAKSEAEAARNYNLSLHKNDRRNIQKNNNFTFNPLGLIVGGIKIGYDRGLADLITIGAKVVYVAPLLMPFHAVGGEFSLLFWPRHPNNGYFIGAFVQISKTFPLTADDYLGVLAVTPGAEMGWRWIWNSGFNIGLGGGFGWAFAVLQDACPSGASCSTIGAGPYYMVQFDLGYAF